jgi:hypothetical protein
MEKVMNKQLSESPFASKVTPPPNKSTYSAPKLVILGSAEELTKGTEGGSNVDCNGYGHAIDPCSA